MKLNNKIFNYIGDAHKTCKIFNCVKSKKQFFKQYKLIKYFFYYFFIT